MWAINPPRVRIPLFPPEKARQNECSAGPFCFVCFSAKASPGFAGGADCSPAFFAGLTSLGLRFAAGDLPRVLHVAATGAAVIFCAAGADPDQICPRRLLRLSSGLRCGFRGRFRSGPQRGNRRWLRGGFLGGRWRRLWRRSGSWRSHRRWRRGGRRRWNALCRRGACVWPGNGKDLPLLRGRTTDQKNHADGRNDKAQYHVRQAMILHNKAPFPGIFRCGCAHSDNNIHLLHRGGNMLAVPAV